MLNDDIKNSNGSGTPSKDDELKQIVIERKRRILSVKNFVFLFVSISLVVFLFNTLDITRTVQTIKNADPTLLLVSLVIYSFSNFFKMLRFRALVSDHKISLFNFYSIVSYHNFFNQIMPARTGELTYVYYLKKIGNVASSRGLHSLIITRIFDMVIISIYFVVSLLIYYGGRTSMAMFFTGIAVGIFSFIVLFKINVLLQIMDRIFRKIVSITGLGDVRIVNMIQEQMDKITDEFNTFDTRKHIPLLFITSALVWVALYLFSFMNIRSLGIQIPLLESVLGSTGAVLTNVLPINSFGSFGTLEAGWTGGFVLVGMNLQDAITTGFAAHIINFIASGILALGCKIIFQIKMRGGRS